MVSISWCVRYDEPGKHRALTVAGTLGAVRHDAGYVRIVPSVLTALRLAFYVGSLLLRPTLMRSCLASLRMPRIRPALVVLAALTLIAHAAKAQRRTAALVGWIKDSSGTPVGGADVQIEAQKTVSRTDSTGRFAMMSLEPGAVSVRIRRLGFDPHTFDVLLHASTIDSVSVTMGQNAQLLDAMRTDANLKRQYKALEDFYKRRSRGGGYFLTRDEIEEHHTNVLSDALRQVPGVRIVRGGAARGSLRFNSAGTKAYDCPPQIWVDGRRMRGADIDDFPATDVEGIELYFGPATTPMQFSQGQIASCGTVVIWTRIPGVPAMN